jgi:hypothetical protein
MKMPKRLMSATFVAMLLANAFAPVAFAQQAAEFDPNNVLNDALLRKYDAMSLADIKLFLSQKGGLGNTFDIDPNDGLLKSGSQLIYDASQRYHVNPQYLLALIQKESSSVETDVPSKKQLEWATGYALCDGCYKSSSLAQKYRGFAKQVDAGAGWIDWYFKTAADQSRTAGGTYDLGNAKVTPQNLATAALYSYTPHIHGNLLLWTIWNRWFGDGSAGLEMPDGSLVRDGRTGAIALVQGGKFRPITNVSVMETRFAGRAPVVLDHGAFLAFLERSGGSPVKFSDYSIVRTETGAMFLLDGNAKRRIVSPQVFAAVGFNPEEVEDASTADVADYVDGDPIVSGEDVAAGQLLQDAKTGGVYYVASGVKHPLYDKALLSVNFPGLSIKRVAPAELAAVLTGTPVTLDDGALVKAANDPTVYVISGGKKRVIPSENVFLTLGYSWSSVKTVSPKLLALHPTGDVIAFQLAAAAPTTAQ